MTDQTNQKPQSGSGQIHRRLLGLKAVLTAALQIGVSKRLPGVPNA